MSGEGPYTAGELAEQLAALGLSPEDRILVAVSGGADSLCLALLAHQVCPTVAVTVDHKLRAGSADEAQRVQQWLLDRGIDHRTLVWEGEKPASNIQAAARKARYGLLEKCALEEGCSHILTAHHQDDQAETFLLRLARGSGLRGLAGMSAIAEVPGAESAKTSLVRPLLDVPRIRLEKALRAMDQEWISDPSNSDEKFARVQARNMLANPPLDDLVASRISSAAASLARAQRALDWYERDLASHCVSSDAFGLVTIRLEVMKAHPEETALRLLSRIINWIGRGDYPPRFARLVDLYDALHDSMSARTLGGAVVEGAGNNSIYIYREIAAAPKAENWSKGQIFDGRWQALKEAGEQVGYGRPDVPDIAIKTSPDVRLHAAAWTWTDGQDARLLEDGMTATLLPLFPEIAK